MHIPTLKGQAVETDFPMGLATAGWVMTQLFAHNLHIPTFKGQVHTECPMGLETAGGLMTQLFEGNMHIPTLNGQAFDMKFPMGLETFSYGVAMATPRFAAGWGELVRT